MKHSVLHALAHNVADSLASGCSLLTGVYELDLFAELAASEDDEIVIDLLSGEVQAAQPSTLLCQAARQTPAAVAWLCDQQRGSVDEFAHASVRFWQDISLQGTGYGVSHRFDVTVEDRRGRRSTIEYQGWPGKRLQVLDARGRRRPKPASTELRLSC